MSEFAKPCIVCGKELCNVQDQINQPYHGLAFMSYGHYGSTRFDPMDGSYLEINICDACLVAAQKKGRILFGRQHQPRVRPGWIG